MQHSKLASTKPTNTLVFTHLEDSSQGATLWRHDVTPAVCPLKVGSRLPLLLLSLTCLLIPKTHRSPLGFDAVIFSKQAGKRAGKGCNEWQTSVLSRIGSKMKYGWKCLDIFPFLLYFDWGLFAEHSDGKWCNGCIPATPSPTPASTPASTPTSTPPPRAPMCWQHTLPAKTRAPKKGETAKEVVHFFVSNSWKMRLILESCLTIEISAALYIYMFEDQC